MGYLVPLFVVAFGLAAEYLVEISASISTNVLLEAEVGVKNAGAPIIADRIVDMRPEASLGDAIRSELPDLLPRQQ